MFTVGDKLQGHTEQHGCKMLVIGENTTFYHVQLVGGGKVAGRARWIHRPTIEYNYTLICHKKQKGKCRTKH